MVVYARLKFIVSELSYAQKKDETMGSKRIVITGMGTVNPLANNAEDTWSNASQGKSGIGKITRFDADSLPAKIAGEVKDFEYRDYFSEDLVKTANRMDPFVHYAAAAMQQALDQSGIEIDKNPERVGICLGSGMGGLQSQHSNSAALATKGPRRVSPFYVPAAIGNIASGLLSMKHGIKGPNFSLQTACASANHSLISAYMVIDSGMADVMVAGGTEAAVTELAVSGFSNMRALSTNFNDTPEKASRPFDKDRDGFVIAEGAGVFIIEEYESARKRGADILCELKSVGMSGDAHDLVMPDPEGVGALASMKMAVQNGQIEPTDIDYINTHGTSTPLGDVAESNAVYQLVNGNESNLNVGSTKSMHGHLLGATAAVEGTICIQAIRHGLIPPNINIDNFDAEIPLTCVNTEPVEKKIQYVLSNSFGFGGHNSSVIFAAV